MLRQHVHEERFEVSPERLFALLHTPSDIREWWGAAQAIVIPQTGGLWAATWGESEDDPDYVTAATIQVFDAPWKMVLVDYRYLAKSGGTPFEADFILTFTVTPDEEGSALHVSQDGFPAGAEADDFYAACEKGWRETFAGIRRHLANEHARRRTTSV